MDTHRPHAPADRPVPPGAPSAPPAPSAPGAAPAPAAAAQPHAAPCAAHLQADLASARAELAQLREAHGDLLRAISHDLRAPLRHVTSFAPLLREIVEPAPLPAAERAEALEFLDTIEQAGQRMGRMVDGLLMLSRIAGAPLRLEPVDLQRLAQGVADGLAPRAAGRPIDWQIGPLPTAQADATLMRQLLHELLGNALLFTRDTPAARIQVACTRAPEGHWQLRVQDNGVGFDMARAAGLFGLFQRLHSERSFPGVGAGLAVVRAVAERHGGRASALAAPGQGCMVEVCWPG